MSAKQAEAAVDVVEVKATKAPARRAEPTNKPKVQPPYAVILHNDPVNGFDFVVGALRKVFRYTGAKAFLLTLRAHATGKCIVWSGSFEVAEFKAEQLRSCGADPRKIRAGATTLGVTLEPLPG